MRFLVSILILALLFGVGASLQSAALETPHGFALVATARPAFLQQSSPSFQPVIQGGGSANPASLPSSVLNHTDSTCSVEAASPPASCSIFPGPDQKCSAHCDGGQYCSAIFNPSGFSASCSVYGKKKALCSVMQPIANTIVNASQCSAFGGSANIQIKCSVMEPGKKQFCSSENPAGFFPGQGCSAFTASFMNQCSVLSSGTIKSYCSTAKDGGSITKTCSTYSANSVCSIGISQTGICSNFVGAAAGTCSAQTGGFCSVIGGSAGTLCIP